MFKAIIIILVLPAILILINFFQDYADANMTLNNYEQIFMDFLPFIVIGLFILGIFKAVGSMFNRDGE